MTAAASRRSASTSLTSGTSLRLSKLVSGGFLCGRGGIALVAHRAMGSSLDRIGDDSMRPAGPAARSLPRRVPSLLHRFVSAVGACCDSAWGGDQLVHYIRPRVPGPI